VIRKSQIHACFHQAWLSPKYLLKAGYGVVTVASLHVFLRGPESVSDLLLGTMSLLPYCQAFRFSEPNQAHE
jgi:hypothetical protein